MPIIAFHSVKGGAGCTTVATLFAVQMYRGHNPVHLSFAGDREQLDDAVAILGTPGVDDYAVSPVGEHFTIGIVRTVPSTEETPYVGDLDDIIQVVDVGGRHSPRAWPAGAARVLVLRNDYLSLRRALLLERDERVAFSGIVLLEDPHWPLHESDVREVTGIPVLEIFQTDDRFQTRLDAGVMSMARHPHFFHHLDRLVGVRP